MSIDVQVAYATPERQMEISLTVGEHYTVAMAIRCSGILKHYPEIDMSTVVVGILGHKVALDTPLESGDRIEIYRPLHIDPKEARRLRAERGCYKGGVRFGDEETV